MPGGKGQASASEAGGRPSGRTGLVFGDGDRVLDKGVWKRFKTCQHCQQLVVERAKWQNCWEAIKFCSDRCKSEGKRAKRQQQPQQPKAQGEAQGEAQQQQQGEAQVQGGGASRPSGGVDNSSGLAA